MIETDIQKREKRDLWVAIAIALTLGVYHLLFNIISSVQYISYQYANWVSNLMFFWVLALLWITYRRWRDAVYRQKELRNILTSISSEVIMVVDSHRRVQMVNESVNIFGFSPEEVLKKTTDLLYLDRREDKDHLTEIRDSIDKVGFHIGQATGQKRTGETFPLEIVTASLKGREGVVIVIKDITERKRAEEAILQAKQVAESANEEKSKLLVKLNENFQKLKSLEALRDNLTHMIVHDMRNPLQVILSIAEVLEMSNKPTMSEKNRAKIKDIVNQAKLLEAMISSLLDVSRLESGLLPLDKKVHDLVLLGKEAEEEIGLLAANVQIFLEEPGYDSFVECDHDIIKRVIVNLLANAIKFSAKGDKIHVAFCRDDSFARLMITDSGPGIALEYHEKIFEKFWQVDSNKRRQMHSSGLGLTFCKLAIEAHGGTIGVESELDKGAKFWFQIPVAALPSVTGTPVAAESVYTMPAININYKEQLNRPKMKQKRRRKEV
jgi:PAS domain S-box-containing protein